MIARYHKIALTVGIVLAMAFTFSCSCWLGEGGCGYSQSSSSSSEYTGGSCNAADYGLVDIGGQIWMAKNWGCYVPGSKCYGNYQANCDWYGRLYDWATAMTVCPSGWHLPSDEDWDKLMNAVGGSSAAGRYLKTSDCGGENKYGFSALPGGYGNFGGNFVNVGYYSYWWSSSEYNANYAYYRYMDCSLDSAFYNYYDKNYLFSVRCLQD